MLIAIGCLHRFPVGHLTGWVPFREVDKVVHLRGVGTTPLVYVPAMDIGARQR
jgi:hypothetical protein